MSQVKWLVFGLILGTHSLTCTSTPSEKIESKPPIPMKVEPTKEYLTIDYLTGHFKPSEHPDFVEIKIEHTDKAGRLLRKDVYDAFIRMYEAAQKAEIQLLIISATRNFEYQKNIWERKWNGTTLLEGGIHATKDISDPVERANKILEYSSMPGTSRHHWGTDIDLNSFNPGWFESGEGKKIFDWLEKNAADYGFCRPYTKKNKERPFGYNEEKWHWSYQPIAEELTTFAKDHFSNQMITDFAGSETAEQINILGHYILGINSNCK